MKWCPRHNDSVTDARIFRILKKYHSSKMSTFKVFEFMFMVKKHKSPNFGKMPAQKLQSTKNKR